MGKLLGIEILLMLLTGLITMFGIPALIGQPPAGVLFLVGFLMALAFVGLYAIANLLGRKMPGRRMVTIALMAYVVAFWGDITLAIKNLGGLTGSPAYFLLAPPAFGLLLALTAVLKPQERSRGEAAAWGLFAYAFPMMGVRWLLVPLVKVNPVASLIAVQAGAIYLLLRGLVRIFHPTAAEGNTAAGPLIRRPVPDQIVGLVEGTTRRSARPFATQPDGSLDDSAISILCREEDLPGVSAKLQQVFAGKPFAVEPGEAVEGKVELVIRPLP